MTRWLLRWPREVVKPPEPGENHWIAVEAMAEIQLQEIAVEAP